MKDSPINQPVSKPKLLGLPRPLAGALIGILIFSLFLLLVRITESQYLLVIVLFPYYATIMFFSGFVFSLSQSENMFFLFLISSIPPAILGSLIFSNKKAVAIGLLVTYVGISMFLGLFVLIAFSD